MKVALINGPIKGGALFMREGRCTQRSSIWSTQWPPISLAYLAAIVKKDGHEPYVFDCPAYGLSRDDLGKKLSRIHPKLCALSVSTPTIEEDLALANMIKQLLPDSMIAVFGTYATAKGEEILKAITAVDVVIRNEPEITFQELTGAIVDTSSLHKVSGLTFRDGEKIIQNPDRPYLDDLDSLPFPDWDAVNLDAYPLPFSGRQFVCVSPLRGCPHHCSFCTAGAYYGHKLRLRSVDSVVKEISSVKTKSGINDFFMWAETFTINKNFVIALSDALKKKMPGIRWTCNSRTDTVDDQMLEAMAKAGCWMISFGFESADEKVQELSGKKLKTMDFAAPVNAARRTGMKVLGHFILGLPGDTPESIRRTIDLALSLDLDFAQFYAAAPFAGSPLYSMAKKEGYLAGVEYEKMSQDTASLKLPELPPKIVDVEIKRAVRRFYLRPKQIIKVLRIAGFGIFGQVLRALFKSLKR